MNDRLMIAKDVLAATMTGGAYWENYAKGVMLALAYADELIKQEALTRVKKEAEEHK